MGYGRICDICGEMHGRTFSVSETQKVIDSVLDINEVMYKLLNDKPLDMSFGNHSEILGL